MATYLSFVKLAPLSPSPRALGSVDGPRNVTLCYIQRGVVLVEAGGLSLWVQLVSEETEAFYDVAKMTELLFGEVDPATSYATHWLLNEDRTYFKQVPKPSYQQSHPVDYSMRRSRCLGAW